MSREGKAAVAIVLICALMLTVLFAFAAATADRNADKSERIRLAAIEECGNLADAQVALCVDNAVGR